MSVLRPQCPASGASSLWQRSRNARTAYLFLLPAFLVMADHHVLSARVRGLDVLHELRADEPQGRRTRAERHRASETTSGSWTTTSSSPTSISSGSWSSTSSGRFSNVVIHLILGVRIALLLNVEGLRLKRFYRAIFIIPVVIPPIIVAIVWRNMFDPQYGADQPGPQRHDRGALQAPAVHDRLAEPAQSRSSRQGP